MNFLTKLFGRNGNSDNSDRPVNANEISGNGFKEMFADENPPEPEFIVKQENVLKLFMDQNLYHKGFNEGYEFHSKENLDSGIENIRTEYQHLLQIVIDEKNSEIYELNISKMQCEGVPGNIIQQLDLRIDKLNIVISKCMEEFELSFNYKGQSEYPINKYRDGFMKGLMQYFNEKSLAKSTGLFN